MELHEALAQISDIRRQMALTEVFRGFRAVPVACSGLLAIAAAALQSAWLPEPTQEVGRYLTLWVGVAVVSFCGAMAEMLVRSRASKSPHTREITLLVIEQFIPSVVAGGSLTFVLVNFVGDWVAMLPGLWQILFSLGIFATCRLLPPALFWIGAFYLLAGVLCIAVAQGTAALSPWAMGVPFGAGQLATAAVLYWTLERSDDAKQEAI